jgi:hypothetical protein
LVGRPDSGLTIQNNGQITGSATAIELTVTKPDTTLIGITNNGSIYAASAAIS